MYTNAQMAIVYNLISSVDLEDITPHSACNLFLECKSGPPPLRGLVTKHGHECCQLENGSPGI